MIGRTNLESGIHDDEPDKILTHHFVFCSLGFIPTIVLAITNHYDDDATRP